MHMQFKQSTSTTQAQTTASTLGIIVHDATYDTEQEDNVFPGRNSQDIMVSGFTTKASSTELHKHLAPFLKSMAHGTRLNREVGMKDTGTACAHLPPLLSTKH